MIVYNLYKLNFVKNIIFYIILNIFKDFFNVFKVLSKARKHIKHYSAFVFTAARKYFYELKQLYIFKYINI